MRQMFQRQPKVRVIGEHQQIVRLDFEEVQEIRGDSY